MIPTRPRIFVSAGEISGDRILGDILRPLRRRFPDMELRGLGGPAAAACGLAPLFPIRDTAFSGAWDVVRNAFFALRMYRTAASALRRFHPQLVLLVDYPGLNLRLARLARNLGVSVCFVAPPQAWAYRRPERKLRRATNALRGCHVHVLFPFEAEAFAATAAGISVGHFLAEAGIPPPPLREGAFRMQPGGKRLLLCPGSRLAVLRRNLPVWLILLRRSERQSGSRPEGGQTAAPRPAISVLVPEHLAAEAQRLMTVHARGFDIRIRTDRGIAFAEARHAIAFPGTITLELALARIPTLVLAILDPLTLALGRRLLGNSPLALPNLLAGEEVFPEWAGRAPGPGEALFRELERRRDGGSDEQAWAARAEKWAVKMGPAAGAQVVCDFCSALFTTGMAASPEGLSRGRSP